MTEKQPPSYPLRMPQELRDRLAEVAKVNGRSMNAEIVARLEASFSGKLETQLFDAELRADLAEQTSEEFADKLAEKLKNPLDELISTSISQAIQQSKIESWNQSQKAIFDFQDAGFGYQRITTNNLTPCIKITFPKSIPQNAHIFLANGIEEAERMWGNKTTVWIEIDGPEVPKFVEDAIDRCLAFGVRIFLSDKHGTVSHGSLKKFSPALIKKIDAAGRGPRWSNLENDFVF